MLFHLVQMYNQDCTAGRIRRENKTNQNQPTNQKNMKGRFFFICCYFTDTQAQSQHDFLVVLWETKETFFQAVY